MGSRTKFIVKQKKHVKTLFNRSMMKVSERPILVKGSDSNMKQAVLLLLGGLLLLGACANKQPKPVVTVEKADGQKLADAYQNQDWETVVAICDTLIDEKDTMNLTIPYAEALAATGNPRKALTLLDKKLESEPQNYYLYQTKGNVYYSMEKFDSALINYEKVIDMNPAYARPYINEAHIYELIGDKEHAIANYLAAARLFEANNYLTEKVGCAKKILELDSTNLDAKELLGANVPR